VVGVLQRSNDILVKVKLLKRACESGIAFILSCYGDLGVARILIRKH